MPIDLGTQRGLNPTQAAAHFPSFKSDKPCHPSKVVRLIAKGILLPDGSRLRLEALRLGSQWVTTTQAITEFGERLAAARLGGTVKGTSPGKAGRRRAERAAKELDALGI